VDAPIVDRGSKVECFTEFLLAQETRDLIAAVLEEPGAGAETVQLALAACWHSLSDPLEPQEARVNASPCESVRTWHSHDEHCVEEHLMVALNYLDHAHWARILHRRS
jgi:hypothetical protein